MQSTCYNNILLLMQVITLFIIFVIVLVVVLLLLNLVLATHRPDTEKVTAYECGFSPIYGQTRNPFTVSFYLVGVLFIIFDLEILYIYPLAVSLENVGLYGYVVILIFFFVLTIGFVFEFGSGALYFTDNRSEIINKEFRNLNF